MRTFPHQQLSVHVFDDVRGMGAYAAQFAAELVLQDQEVGIYLDKESFSLCEEKGYV